MEVSHAYDDIIRLPHHVSEKHPQMALSDRAAQFSPFAALTGYEAAVDETARLTDEKIQLSEDRIAAISHLLAALQPGDAVSVYIKSILPEKMKIKLVIIGVCKKENAGRAVPRFPIEEAEHIERWTYSPPGCVREIGTVFDGDPDAAL